MERTNHVCSVWLGSTCHRCTAVHAETLSKPNQSFDFTDHCQRPRVIAVLSPQETTLLYAVLLSSGRGIVFRLIGCEGVHIYTYINIMTSDPLVWLIPVVPCVTKVAGGLTHTHHHHRIDYKSYHPTYILQWREITLNLKKKKLYIISL